ncbi:type I-E CRISPR-associated protein Cse2/CasB [uncultured Thiohalocapsa sp.]|uniref:type I-E CRISPR-associated protein Cse2/CasB n=1 Tax=uncultured Thiohalocapsa sp. TaxID=768990 RepID=UPI0025EBADAA|nr:type I-E CRISPR-associated protein Cse2/CasB [uncultured Thiohalocapsa sp.]
MGEPTEHTDQLDFVQATLAWWEPLVTPPETGKPSNRGELAALRRCKNLEEVLFVPAYHRLFYQVSALGWKDRPTVAAVAGLLAHVKGDSSQSGGDESEAARGDQPTVEAPVPQLAKTVAALLATPTRAGLGPRVSELRFQRLVAIRELKELYPNLLRTIHLAGDRVPVADLIRSVRYWTDRQRRDWVQRYYDTLLQQRPDNRAQGA